MSGCFEVFTALSMSALNGLAKHFFSENSIKRNSCVLKMNEEGQLECLSRKDSVVGSDKVFKFIQNKNFKHFYAENPTDVPTINDILQNNKKIKIVDVVNMQNKRYYMTPSKKKLIAFEEL